MDSEKPELFSCVDLSKTCCCAPANLTTYLLDLQSDGQTIGALISPGRSSRQWRAEKITEGLLRIDQWYRSASTAALTRPRPLTSALGKLMLNTETLTLKAPNEQVKVAPFGNARQLNNITKFRSACKMPEFWVVKSQRVGVKRRQDVNINMSKLQRQSSDAQEELRFYL